MFSQELQTAAELPAKSGKVQIWDLDSKFGYSLTSVVDLNLSILWRDWEVEAELKCFGNSVVQRQVSDVSAGYSLSFWMPEAAVLGWG